MKDLRFQCPAYIDCLVTSAHHRSQSSLRQAADRQPVTALDAGLFEDVFQVDFDGAWSNTQFERDLLVLEPPFTISSTWC